MHPQPARTLIFPALLALFALLHGCGESEPTYDGTTLTRWLELAEVPDPDTQLGAIKALTKLHFTEGTANADITATFVRVSRSDNQSVALAAAHALQPADRLAATQAAEWICAHDDAGKHVDDIVEIIRGAPRSARQQLRPVVAENLTKHDSEPDCRRRLQLLLTAIDAPD